MYFSRVPASNMEEMVELLQSSLGSKGGDFDICFWNSFLILVKIKHKFLGKRREQGTGVLRLLQGHRTKTQLLLFIFLCPASCLASPSQPCEEATAGVFMPGHLDYLPKCSLLTYAHP